MTDTVPVGGVPLPPKRPTIIRPSTNSGTEDGENVRPVPSRPPPSRPTPARPAPPPPGVPARPPTKALSKDTQHKPDVPSSRPHTDTRASVKKRPEITIVSAKPMSEVGFRGETKPQSEPEQSKPGKPSRPVPSRPPPQGRPPPPSKTSPRSNNAVNLMDEDVGLSELPPPMSLTQPSSAVNDLLDLEPEKPPQKPQPPFSRPPAPPPRIDGSGDPSLPSRPPPLPHRPKPSGGVDEDEKEKPPTPPVRVTSIHDEDTAPPVLASRGPPVPAARPPVPDNNRQDPPKLLRPTIIRPGKLNEAKPSEDNSKQAVIQAEPEYAVVNKPKPKSSESENGGLPFKVKLRSTASTPNEEAVETPPVPPKHFDDVPTPAVKPKPTVLPKPKPSPDKEEVTETSPEAPVPKTAAKRPTIIRPPPKPKRLHEDESSEPPAVDPEPEKVFPPIPARRPMSSADPQKDTTQEGSSSPRPVPAKRPVSVASKFEEMIKKENEPEVVMRRHPQKLDSPDQREDGPSKPIPPKPKARKTTPLTTPDSPNFDTSKFEHAKPPPPRPTGRPKSMVVEKSPDSEGERSKGPPPRPSGRPMSVMVPKHTAITPTKDDESKHKPPRPGGGPTRKPSDDKTDDDDSPKQKPPRPGDGPQRKPSDDKTDDETSPKHGPPRPSSRPTSMVNQKTSGEHEEEMETLKAKPPRPTGRPPPKKSPTQTDEDVHRRPARPQGGPPRPMSTPLKSPGTVSRHQPQKPSPPKTGAKAPELPPLPCPDHPLYHYVLTVPHGVAKFDYQATERDEISFRQNTIVTLVRRIDSEWLVGKVGNNEGMFPAGFVDIIHPLHDEIPDFVIKEEPMPSWDEPDHQKKTSSITSGPRCMARFDFEGEGKDDLMFEEEDVIKLVGRVGSEWLKGELDGKTGIFPLAYVEIIEDLPAESAEKHSDGHVTAMFDFDGRDDELTFQAGQKLTVLSCINTEWLYGEVEGRHGKFPSAFIDFIPPDLPQHTSTNQETHNVSHDSDTTSHMTDLVAESKEPIHEPVSSQLDMKTVDQSQPHCIADHDYDGQEGDLSFQTGEIIQLTERIGSDWLRGHYGDKEGMFPAGFVTVKIDLPEAPSADSVPVRQAKALYDFVRQGDTELSFKEGDLMELGETVAGAPDWQYGTLNGKTGMFPSAFVEPIS